jgi:ABC-type nickel/cobalt efflux system permease component RcnA
VVLMLIVAALLEAFARQLLNATMPRLIVGAFMLVFWTGYLFIWRRERKA